MRCLGCLLLGCTPLSFLRHDGVMWTAGKKRRSGDVDSREETPLSPCGRTDLENTTFFGGDELDEHSIRTH